MRKLLALSFFLLCGCLPAQARHIAGGEIYYQVTSENLVQNTRTYTVTLRLFRTCNSPGPLLENEQVIVGVYVAGRRFTTVTLPWIPPVERIQLNTNNFPCLSSAPVVCYQVAYYSNSITLPINADGYTLSRLGCCRIDFISNLAQSTSVGSNYITQIPGTNALPSGANNSPIFNLKDTALVCAQKRFTLDFGATDADKDSLSYAFCTGFSSPGGLNAAAPPNELSLIPLLYGSAYSGTAPLGNLVTINPRTGIISGMGPNPGTYVVSVCITEWRGGRPINEHRKDFILEVQACDYLDADLPDKIIECKSLSVKLENLSNSSGILRYEWSFGDSLVNSFPQSGSVVHQYPAPGTYKARLTVFGPRGCVGTDSTLVAVYPGFQPGFVTNGSCIQNPYLFRDTTRSVHGVVNEWRWDFGETSTLSDTSLLRQASYTYLTAATKEIRLIVADSRGCRDTVRKNLVVSNTPVVPLPFTDTLICNIDTLPITISNPGQYQWQPAYNIIGAQTATPKVYPQRDTWYTVTMNDNGCRGTDSLLVRVLPFVRVNAGSDTVVCANDLVPLQATSAGLQFQWTASSGELVAAAKNPVVRPNQSTWYTVIANLGKCQDKDSVWVQVLPLPQAFAGRDTVLCSATRINLNAHIRGTQFEWSPTNAMLNANTLRPVVAPGKTTTYVLSVRDSLGCPKTVRDSLTITVVPPLQVSAGPDSFVVKNQPIQLQASGAATYLWSPATGLNDPTLPNPIAVLDGSQDSILYRVVGSVGACSASDQMLLRVYNGGPTLWIPSAFSPNGDGKNDVLRPTVVGLTALDYFRVYNRWGKLVFETKQLGVGWDGRFQGEPQGAGVYVVEAQGIDIEGKRLYAKGTAVLIR